MKVNFKKISFKYEERELFDDLDDDIIRPLYFTTFILYILKNFTKETLFDYFLIIIGGILFSTLYIMIDLLILPFKLLNTIEVVKQ